MMWYSGYHINNSNNEYSILFLFYSILIENKPEVLLDIRVGFHPGQLAGIQIPLWWAQAYSSKVAPKFPLA